MKRTLKSISIALLLSLTLGGAARAFDYGTQVAVASADVTFPDATVNTVTTSATCVKQGINDLIVAWQIQNTGSVSMRCGDANVGASQGLQIAAGATETLATNANVYCYSASSTTAACLEMKR